MDQNGPSRIRRSDGVRENGISHTLTIEELDPWTAWLYKPRTITLLLVGACFLIWSSGVLDPDSSSSRDIVCSVKRGVWAMIAVVLTYCLLQAPSTLLIRPHPAIWRLVHGMAVVYLVALTFLLFQNRDDARQFMKYLHPDLGIELPERSYAADCRIYVPENTTNRFKNVYDTVFDEFVLAHIVGWWGKAIMIRNQPLLWLLSIGFEFMEFQFIFKGNYLAFRFQLTFRHMLPNFNECWWDSIVLDILICNWFGIWAGMRTVRHFDGKTYEWVGISRQPDIMGKVKRTLEQFTPAHWDKDEWHPLQGPWRFIQVLCLCIIFLTVELNTFFLKFCLWIPPRNPIVIYRLFFWWLIAIPAVREYNSYLQDRKPVKKVGAFCWLTVAICIVELLICIKFGHGESRPMMIYPKCLGFENKLKARVVPEAYVFMVGYLLDVDWHWSCGFLGGLVMATASSFPEENAMTHNVMVPFLSGIRNSLATVNSQPVNTMTHNVMVPFLTGIRNSLATVNSQPVNACLY
ncbi:CDP-diacylglycerol--serine O-phosphatidyltransferase 1-like protein [Drosera capensis]